MIRNLSLDIFKGNSRNILMTFFDIFSSIHCKPRGNWLFIDLTLGYVILRPVALTWPEPRLNIKTVFPGYGDSHVKDKTVGDRLIFNMGDPYTGKTTSLYWDGPKKAQTPGACFTVKPVYNDHLYNKIYCLWFIQSRVLMKTEGTNLLLLTISAFWSSSRWPLAT